MSIMISLPSGGRTLETARVTSDTNEYFLTGRRNPSGGATIPLGDRGRRPTPLGLSLIHI